MHSCDLHIISSLRCGEEKGHNSPVKYWEIIADNLHDAGGRRIWIVDAHGYGKRFIVSADEILSAFLELERAIH